MIAAAAGRPSVSLAARGIHQTLGGVAVLRGVDVDVPAGSTTAVVGPSGSGKSTLLRSLNRLHQPDGGDILLDGRVGAQGRRASRHAVRRPRRWTRTWSGAAWNSSPPSAPKA